MSLSLTKLASAVSATLTIVDGGQKLLAYVGELMDAAESAYESAVDAGATKKAAVLALAKALWEAMGNSWEAIEAQVSAYIDLLKSGYNTIKAALSDEDAAVAVS